MRMTGKDARNLLEVMKTKWSNKIAFFRAADAAKLSNSDFGKLLHAKDWQTLDQYKEDYIEVCTEDKRFVVIRDYTATPMKFIISGLMSRKQISTALKFNRLQEIMLKDIWKRPEHFYDCIGDYQIQFADSRKVPEKKEKQLEMF